MRRLLNVGVTSFPGRVLIASVMGQGRLVTGSIAVARNLILCLARNWVIGTGMAALRATQRGTVGAINGVVGWGGDGDMIVEKEQTGEMVVVPG